MHGHLNYSRTDEKLDEILIIIICWGITSLNENRDSGQNHAVLNRKYPLSPRVVRCWNSLAAWPGDFSSLNNFKRLLESADFSTFIL